MIINNILEGSKGILLLKTAYSKYPLIEERLNEIWGNSALYIKTKRILSIIAFIFQHSFVRKIIEMIEGVALKESLANSRIVKCLLRACNRLGWKLAEYFKTSFTVKQAVGFKNELYTSSVKKGSVIIVTVILSNIFIYALFKNTTQKEFGLLGWIIKGMLLFVGLAGLFCEIGLKNIISTSLFLKLINCYKQPELEEE